MNIICCRSTDEVAEAAFRLRYEVFTSERGYGAPDKDHETLSSRDAIDEHARIYVAFQGDQAIATARVVYSRDCDYRNVVPSDLASAWKIGSFLERFPQTLSFATKFAISPKHRNSLAAAFIMSRIYADMIDDGIDFVFSMCSSYLIDFYSHLGFRVYSPTYANDVGFTTPIVSVLRDWRHLQAIGSPTLKLLKKRNLCTDEHPSVAWFYHSYGDKLDTFVSGHSDATLNKMLTLGKQAEVGSFDQSNIFQNLSEDDIKIITEAGHVFNVSAGQLIIQTMQKDDEMFIVVDGDVIERRLDGELPSLKISSGQVLGEIGLFTGTIRTTDLIAITNTQLVSVSRQGLERLIKTKPDLAARLLFNVARLQSLKLVQNNKDMLALCFDLHHD